MAEPDIPWMPKVRDTKILTIRNDADVGLWSGLVTTSVPIFNDKIMKALNYNIVTEGKANVIVKVAGAGKDDPKVVQPRHMA